MTAARLAEEPSQEATKRVGLVVIHGIGTQRRAETLRSVVAGLERAYGRGSFKAKCDRGEGQSKGEVFFTMAGVRKGSAPFDKTPEVRVYEAYWAPVLSGEAVSKTFSIDLAQQFVWYPLLNRRHVKGFGDDYPWWVVWRWTLVLVPLGALLTAAYYALGWLLDVLKGLVKRPRESTTLSRLAQSARSPAWLRRFLTVLKKDAQEGGRRNLLDRFLDTQIADIFNYVNSAGGATTKVPGAAREIYQVLHDALARAVRDGCTEVQILAHSLGTVIAYHALTSHREETERVVSLGAPSEGQCPLTRLYTIGSPLEKVRFFWPKLVPSGPPVELLWDNFKSRGDPVAGVLGKFDIVAQVENHWVRGAWGLLTAHNGYRRNPSFLKIFGCSLTGRPSGLRVSGREKARMWLSGLGQAVGVPLLLLVLAGLGVGYMFASGWIAGAGLGILLSVLLNLSGASAGLQSSVAEWTPRILGWTVPLLLVSFGLVWGYVRGSKIHRDVWQKGVTLERRTKVASESPYRKPGSYGILLAQVIVLAAIAWVGLSAGPEGRFTRPQAWFVILVLMALFAVLAGRGITKFWRGILIDNRNKMSLSRLQLIAWTLVILSAIVTAVLTNVAGDSPAPLTIAIPPELWVLMGISTAAAVGSPALLSAKGKKPVAKQELEKTAEALQGQARVNVDVTHDTVVVRNVSAADARWGDILKGDEVGNATTVDLGKLQMFFFTFVLVLGYSAAIVSLLSKGGLISSLPPIDESMNTLLGISQTGYLASKTVSVSSEPKPAQKKDGKGGDK